MDLIDIGYRIRAEGLQKANKEIDALLNKSGQLAKTSDKVAKSSDKVSTAKDKEAAAKKRATAAATREVAVNKQMLQLTKEGLSKAQARKIAMLEYAGASKFVTGQLRAQMTAENQRAAMMKKNAMIERAHVAALIEDRKRSTKALKQNQTQAIATAGSFDLLGKAMQFAYLTYTLGNLIKMADTMTLLKSRVSLVTPALESVNEQFLDLTDIAAETRASLESTITLYNRLQPSLQIYGKTTEDVKNVITAFNNSLLISGATAKETQSAILQFSQSMAAGKLAGDEFRAVTEAAPELLRAIAEGSSTARDKLKDMSRDGLLTTKFVTDALLKSFDELERKAKGIPVNIGQAMTNLRTSFALFITQANEATGATSSLAEEINGLAKQLRELAKTLDFDEVIKNLKVLGEVLLWLAGVGIAKYVFRIGRGVKEIFKFDKENKNLLETLYTVGSAIFFGASAYTAYTGHVEKSKTAVDDFRQSLVGMSEDQISSEIIRIQTEMSRLQEEISATNTNLSNFDGFANLGKKWRQEQETGLDMDAFIADWVKSVKVLQGEYDILQQFVGVLVKRQKELEKLRTSATEDQRSKEVKSLEEEISLLKNGVSLEKAKHEARLSVAEDSEVYQILLERELYLLTEQRKQQDQIVEAQKERRQELQVAQATFELVQKNVELERAKLQAQYEAGVLTKAEYENKLKIHKLEKDTNSILEQRKSSEELANFNIDFDSDAFEAFDQFGKSVYGVIDALNELQEEQQKVNDLYEKSSKTQEDLNTKRILEFRNSVAGYAAMSGAAKTFFEEGSKGYKTLEAVETAFRAAEMTMAIANFAEKLGLIGAETAAFVAAEGAKASAAGATGVAAQTQIPIVGFALGAAMIAFLASIGVNPNGGSGGGSGASVPSFNMNPNFERNEGGVLGDAEALSESVANSLESIEDLSGQQVAYLAQMVSSLRGIETSSSQAAASIVRSGLGVGQVSFGGSSIGQFLSSGASGFESDRTVWLQQELNKTLAMAKQFDNTITAGLGKHFADVAQQLAQQLEQSRAADLLLGGEKQRFGSAISQGITGIISSAMQAFGQLGIQAGDISSLILPNLVLTGAESGEEVQDKISGFFSGVGDAIVAQTAPFILSLQKIGEGALETLNRVVAETQVFKDSIESLGVTLNVGGQQLIFISNSLSEMAGGLDSFSDNVNDFLDLVLTDEEKLERTTRAVTALFSDMEQSVPASVSALREFVLSLDLTKDAGREAFNTITSSTDLLEEYYDAINDQREVLKDVNLEILDVTKSLLDFVKEIKAELLSPQQSLAEIQRDFFATVNLAKTGDLEAARQISTLGKSLIESTRSTAADELELKTIIATVIGATTSAARTLEGQIDPALLVEQEQLNVLTDIRNILAGTPGFATGGVHAGGLRVVGERGPELEFTGPSRIIPNSQLGSVGSNQALIEEIRGLRADLRAGQAVIAGNSGRIAKILKRVDDGDAILIRDIATT